MISKELIVDQEARRLDQFVSNRYLGMSRSRVQQLILDGWVLLNGVVSKASDKIKVGDQITVTIPPAVPLKILPESIPLTIVYQDRDLLVVDKPAGMPVHPGPGHSNHTLVNAVLNHCPSLGGIKGTSRPGIVHRLDKDTSGLIVVAKNDVAQQGLQRQFKERSVIKRYLALAKGRASKIGATRSLMGLGRSDMRVNKQSAVVSKYPILLSFLLSVLLFARLDSRRSPSDRGRKG